MPVQHHLILSLLLGCTACGVSPAPALSFDVQEPRLSATEFPGAEQLLRGFGDRSRDTVWRRGDAVLFGLRLRRGESSQRWLLHVAVEEPEAKVHAGEQADDPREGANGAVLPPVTWPIKVNGRTESFHSVLCRVAVTVASADGAVLAETHPLLPRDFLQHGFSRALRQVQRVMHDFPGLGDSQEFYDYLDARELAESVVCAVALVQVVQGDEVLSPILWQVVQRPSLMSVIANFGAEVVIQPRFHDAMRVEAPQGLERRGPVWSVPMRLFVNDSLALSADLLVGGSEAPLATCGGILGVSARHPKDATVEFSMLLLAAQRGTEPASSEPASGAAAGTAALDQRSLDSGRETALDRR
jgi:hypothetical protein